MAHPDWALKFKTKGTELRNIGGRFYLYRISSAWNTERKVTQKITHEMIGRITEEDGLVLKGHKTAAEIKKKALKEREEASIRLTWLTNISAREYGASSFLSSNKLSSDLFESLKTFFPENYREIFTLATCRLLHQSPLKNMEYLYESSMISEKFKGLDLSKNKLTSFMKEIGGQREVISNFMKSLSHGSNNIVFDTTHLVSQSEKMQLNQQGYNSQGSFDPQVNLFYMFSTDLQTPVYYRIFPGNIQGMSALKLTMKESNLNDSCMVGDKGFCSEANIEMFEACGIKYILPLKRNSRFISYERLKTRDYEKAFDGHFFYNNRTIFYYRYKIDEEGEIIDNEVDDNKVNQKSEGKKELKTAPAERSTVLEQQQKGGQRDVVIFYDPSLRLNEETCYLRRIEGKAEGYNMTGFKDKQFTFGTMSVVTNLKSDTKDNNGAPQDLPAQKIYERYKSRMEVETVFDMYKNLLQADKSYMQSDEAFEAWVFINHVATILYYKVFNLIKSKDKLSCLSPKDLLMRLSRVQKLKMGGEWVTSEITASSLKLFKTLGIVLDDCYVNEVGS